MDAAAVAQLLLLVVPLFLGAIGKRCSARSFIDARIVDVAVRSS